MEHTAPQGHDDLPDDDIRSSPSLFVTPGIPLLTAAALIGMVFLISLAFF
jgi:hypothetical protein